LAAYLAKTAPKTDADRLARFMRDLFGGDIETERKERERLTRQASSWLSGAIDAGRAGAPPAAAAPRRIRATPSPSPTPAPPPVAARSPPAVDRGPPAAPAGGGSGEKDPRIGTTIGERYYLRRLCGEGAMGRVYEAQHIDIGKRVAIKILQSTYR